MTRDEELLVEKTLSAYRRRDVDGSIQVSPAWADLDAAGRTEAFEQGVKLRRIERALDPQGLSSTARAVLQRIKNS